MQVSVTVSVIKDGNTFERVIGLSETALDKVLFGFNVTDDPRVTALKAMSGAQIQMMLDHQAEQKNPPPSPEPCSPEFAAMVDVRQARGRAAAVAITQTELTQMALVKSLFAKA